MKVSKDQKDEIRKKLVNAAIDLITEKGFQDATMREIASRAGVGSATIYNYFPTKEKILYAYFLDKQSELAAGIEKIPDFSEFSLKEKLQTQIETLLDLYLADREFVQMAYKMMFDSPMRTFSEFVPVRDIYTAAVVKFIESSIEKGEIAEHPFKDFIANLYWDYSGVILLYWLRDDSENFSNTSQLIDKSLDLIVDILRSGIISRLTDVVSFLFRSHLYNNFQRIAGMFSRGEELRKYFTDQKPEMRDGESNGRRGQTK